MSEKEKKGAGLTVLRDTGSLAVIIVALSAFLVFSGTLGHQLVWDDEPVIRYSRRTVEEGGLKSLALAPFSTGVDGPDELTGYYRPVSLASMWINSPYGDISPLPYHLVNLLLHVINSLLVFSLLTLMIPTGPGALLGGLIFAVHPVHAESVAFVSGRTDLLAALFTLLVVILWHRYQEAEGAPSRRYFALGMLSFAVACLSKEIAFVLPGVILFWVMTRGEPESDEIGKGIWMRGRWIFGLSLVLGAVMFLRTMILKIGTGPGWSKYAQLGDASMLSLLGDVLVNVMQYLRLMVFPWPLAVFYPPVPPRLTWVTLVSVGVFLLTCLLLSGRKHRRIGIIALMWTLIFLFPVSGIIGLGQSVIAERFCYLPSVGVVMVMGYTLGQIRPQSVMKHLHTFMVIVLLLLFSAGSVLHAGRWKDDLTLFTNALYTGPVKVPTMYVSLGIAYKDRGDTKLALQAFEEAVRMDPSFLRGLLNLGVAQIDLGYYSKAVQTFERTEVLDPMNPAVWYHRGVALEELGRSSEALEAYNRTAELDPGEPAAHFREGQLLAGMGRHEESLAAFQEAVLADPGHVGAHLGVGRAHEKMGRMDLAVEMFMKAIEVQPDEIVSYGDLGRVLLATDRVLEAIEVFRLGAAMDPHDTITVEGLVVSYFRAGQRDKAIAYVEGLKKIDPGLYGKLLELIDKIDNSRGNLRKGSSASVPAGVLSLDKMRSDK